MVATARLLTLLVLTGIPLLAQDSRSPAKETPFDTAKFPIVLKPDPKKGVASYIAIPVKHVEGTQFKADIKLKVETHPGGESDRRSVSLVLQTRKTARPSGFWVTSRRLELGKTLSTTIHTSVTSSNRKKFYIHILVPHDHGPVTIEDITLTGFTFIEREAASREEEKEIRKAILDLAADGFKVRRAAQKKILAYGEKAVAIVREFKDDDDPERRQRIRTILQTLEESLKEKYPPVGEERDVQHLPKAEIW